MASKLAKTSSESVGDSAVNVKEATVVLLDEPLPQTIRRLSYAEGAPGKL